jgi:hypothetical protein
LREFFHLNIPEKEEILHISRQRKKDPSTLIQKILFISVDYSRKSRWSVEEIDAICPFCSAILRTCRVSVLSSKVMTLDSLT